MDSANNNALRQVDVDVHAPAFDAYNSFKSQFDQLQHCPQARSEGQTGPGMPESQLDKLSLVWLEQKNDALGRDITHADLDAPQANAFDSLMAAHVSKQYETIRHAHFDHEGGFLLIGSKEKDALTKADIDASLQTAEKRRQSMDYADPLMANNGNLFAVLSKVHDGVRSINYWDVKEAREVDDYQQAKGTRLFTDEQRSAIDQMYHRWSKGDMRAIEDRPQDSNMGCDGAITAESLARGTGFQNVDEMKQTFNQPLQLVTEAEYCRDQEAQRQHQILRNARRMWSDANKSIDEHTHYSVQGGQGFDRIARQVMTSETGAAPTEPDVVSYSKSIAQMNGYDRDSYDPKTHSLQPGQTIQVHDQQWQDAQRLKSIGEIQDYVRESIDNNQ